jgi:hypothetical protein
VTVIIQLIFGFVHPTLSFSNQPLVLIHGLKELVLIGAKIEVKRVYQLHLDSSHLLSPFFKFVMDLSLYLLLPLFEHSVVLIIVLIAIQVHTLLMQSLIHVLEDIYFKRDFFGNILFLSHIMTFVSAKECTLGADSLLVVHTNELERPTMLLAVAYHCNRRDWDYRLLFR